MPGGVSWSHTRQSYSNSIRIAASTKKIPSWVTLTLDCHVRVDMDPICSAAITAVPEDPHLSILDRRANGRERPNSELEGVA